MVLKFSQIVALSIFLKCIEEYSFAGAHKLLTLSQCGVVTDDTVYKKVSLETDMRIED